MELNNLHIFILFAICANFLFSCKEENHQKYQSTPSENEILELPYFSSEDFTPQWTKGEHKIPSFSFVNQNGQQITNETYKGKIYIADFFFTTCPGICPKLTQNMRILQNTYEDDPSIMLLSHTVMPWFDTVEVLHEYAVKNEVQRNKWNLVTGDKKDIYRLARNGYFVDNDQPLEKDIENDFIHTENLFLVDNEGYIRGLYNGTLEIDIQRLKRHIAILKKKEQHI